jgi:hypothetical protein
MGSWSSEENKIIIDNMHLGPSALRDLLVEHGFICRNRKTVLSRKYYLQNKILNPHINWEDKDVREF